MRIVLCCRVFPDTRMGGMPAVCLHRANALAARSHDVHVITTGLKGASPCSSKPHSWPPHLKRLLSEHDYAYTVHHLNCPPEAYTPEFAAACQRKCQELRPDILHLDSCDRARRWWVDSGVKVKAVTMHGLSVGLMLTDWSKHRLGTGSAPVFRAVEMLDEAQALATFDKVLAISRWERQIMRDMYGLRPILVWNPIHSGFHVAPVPVPANGYFMAAGLKSTSGNRNFGSVASAAAKAKVPFKAIQNVDWTDMPRVYDQARALVVASSWVTGFDLAVNEALARCRPVIVTNVGSYGVEAEHCPYLVPYPLGDQDALEEIMRRPLPVVPAGAADAHHPKWHTHSWLQAMGV